jgi:hypothetical protein
VVKWITILLVVLGLGFGFLRWRGREGYIAPQRVYAGSNSGLRETQVKSDPQQVNLWIPRTWSEGGFRYRAMAEFAVTGKVLIKTDFSDGPEAQVSPVDLTFGWGEMATDRYLKSISLSHSGRFYQWQHNDPGLNNTIIETHSANMHMIPKNAKVDRTLRQIKQGELVSVVGYLVNLVSEEDGWSWKTSTRRSDTGGGACELIWVDQVYRDQR